jgi:hypothetical protein
VVTRLLDGLEACLAPDHEEHAIGALQEHDHKLAAMVVRRYRAPV